MGAPRTAGPQPHDVLRLAAPFARLPYEIYYGLMPARYDVAIIGGGIIGLATARALLERAPTARLVVLE